MACTLPVSRWSLFTNHCADEKIHAGSTKPAERSGNEKLGANAGVVLFREPKTEQGEVAAKKSLGKTGKL